MIDNYCSYFCIYIVWHPQSLDGKHLAEHIFKYIYGDPEYPLVNDISIPVQFRSQPLDTKIEQPKPISFENSLNSATFVLIDAHMVMSDSWQSYIEQLWRKAQNLAPHHRIYPVAITLSAYNLSPILAITNFIRIYEKTEIKAQQEKLLRQILHSCCRQLKQVESGENIKSEKAPPPIKLFLSHAKQDGVDIAKGIRRWIEEDEALNTFFDTKDITPGYDFIEEIEAGLKDSALLICQTDAYATRYWCRWEVLTAKKYLIPSLLVNALNVGEERSFPYLGNIPTLRWQGLDSIPTIITKILLEVLQYYYFPAYIENLKKIGRVPKQAIALPYAPELLTQLQQLSQDIPKQDNLKIDRLLIYPDPPVGDEEVEILHSFNPSLKAWTPSQPMSLVKNLDPKPLSGKIVGISISDSPDLERLGFSSFHLQRTLIEISRHLLAQGATIAYGGDLRPDGFTIDLIEMVKVYNKQATERGNKILNFLAWPLHLNAPIELLAEKKNELSVREIPLPEFLKQSFDIDEQSFLKPDSTENRYVWACCLTAMRETMAETIDARIILGGKVTNYKGAFPGIAQEANLILQQQKPLFVLGAFGGCARAVGEAIMGNNPESLTQNYQIAQSQDYADLLDFYNQRANSDAPHEEINYDLLLTSFQNTGFQGINNGLTEAENQRLFTTEDLDEMVYLILKGLQHKNENGFK
ncbi:MAG: TIR domain-containing protein [Waterburya sp.]